MKNVIKKAKYNINQIIGYIVKYDESLCMTTEMISSDITNLKLQKLLYYAQCHYVANFNQKLFPDAVVNWKHGPVVQEVYYDFNQFGSNSIASKVVDEDIYDASDVSRNDKDVSFLNAIMNYYNKFSPWALRDMTHDENNGKNPWSVTLNGEEILPETMSKFFNLTEFKKRIEL